MTDKEAPPYPMPDLKDLSLGNLLGDQLLVRRWPSETESPGGIILPDSSRSKQDVGWIVKIATVPEDLDGFGVGDTVTFNATSPIDDLLSGDDILLIKTKDVNRHIPLEKQDATESKT